VLGLAGEAPMWLVAGMGDARCSWAEERGSRQSGEQKGEGLRGETSMICRC
jgi:hypothetical protein